MPMLTRIFSLVSYLLGAMSKDFSGVQKPYTGQFTLSTGRNTSKYGIK